MPSIMLVDNDVQTNTGFAQYLQEQGYTVSSCTDGNEALKVLQKTNFDVVVSDIHLQGLADFALLNWVTINRPDIKVVATTGNNFQPNMAAATRMGAHFCLEKPIKHSTLLETVRAALSDEGFTGTISSITLADYLQLCIYTTTTRIIDVIHGKRSGRIIVRDGVITYAKCENLYGEEAFFEILSWEGGRIDEGRLSRFPEPNIHQESNFLLLEATRIHDEHLHETETDMEPESDEAIFATEEPIIEPPSALIQVLSKSLHIQSFGIFDRQNHIVAKSGKTIEIENATPSSYLEILQGSLEGDKKSAFKHLVIKTGQGSHYCIFNHGEYRIIAAIKSGAKPEDIMKDVARVKSE